MWTVPKTGPVHVWSQTSECYRGGACALVQSLLYVFLLITGTDAPTCVYLHAEGSMIKLNIHT